MEKFTLVNCLPACRTEKDQSSDLCCFPRRTEACDVLDPLAVVSCVIDCMKIPLLKLCFNWCGCECEGSDIRALRTVMNS